MKQCRYSNPTLVDKIRRWFNPNIDLHQWVYYTRKSKTMIYYCRICECGRQELHQTGVSGDNKWHDICEPLQLLWEQDDFNSARSFS